MESEFPLSKAALSIWAKTNFWHSAPPDGVNKQWLPLAVHMADSGEVAELIWKKSLTTAAAIIGRSVAAGKDH